MGRSKVVLIAVVAFVFAAVLTFVGYRILIARAGVKVAQETASVVVATERLTVGTRLEAGHLRTRLWNRSDVIEGSFSTVDELIGRGVVWPIQTNEPILDSKLAPTGAGGGLTAVIPEGMRALSVKVDDVIGVAGFAVPGTHVDVILIGSPDEKYDSDTSRVILENVHVLAAGQNIERDAQGKPQNVQVVTLTVNPEDAQKLALAASDGRIQLALRNPLDLEYSNPSPTKRTSLYSAPSSNVPPPSPPVRRQPSAAPKPEKKPEPQPLPPPVKKVFNVEVIQGDQRETLTFEKDETTG